MAEIVANGEGLDGLRKSLEITVSFLIAILIVIIIPLIATIPAYTDNSVAQGSMTIHFNLTLYNSPLFLLLVFSIVCVWLFVALSYLASTDRKKLWTLCMSAVFLLLSTFALLSLLWVHSNFLKPMSLSLIIGSIGIGVIIYVAVFFWRIAKYNTCH